MKAFARVEEVALTRPPLWGLYVGEPGTLIYQMMMPELLEEMAAAINAAYAATRAREGW